MIFVMLMMIRLVSRRRDIDLLAAKLHSRAPSEFGDYDKSMSESESIDEEKVSLLQAVK